MLGEKIGLVPDINPHFQENEHIQLNNITSPFDILPLGPNKNTDTYNFSLETFSLKESKLCFKQLEDRLEKFHNYVILYIVFSTLEYLLPPIAFFVYFIYGFIVGIDDNLRYL